MDISRGRENAACRLASLLPTVRQAIGADHEVLTWQEALPDLYNAELLDKAHGIWCQAAEHFLYCLQQE